MSSSSLFLAASIMLGKSPSGVCGKPSGGCAWKRSTTVSPSTGQVRREFYARTADSASNSTFSAPPHALAEPARLPSLLRRGSRTNRSASVGREREVHDSSVYHTGRARPPRRSRRALGHASRRRRGRGRPHRAVPVGAHAPRIRLGSRPVRRLARRPAAGRASSGPSWPSPASLSFRATFGALEFCAAISRSRQPTFTIDRRSCVGVSRAFGFAGTI